MFWRIAVSWPKIRLCKYIRTEYYDFKMFTRIFWQFAMKFAPLTGLF